MYIYSTDGHVYNYVNGIYNSNGWNRPKKQLLIPHIYIYINICIYIYRYIYVQNSRFENLLNCHM